MNQNPPYEELQKRLKRLEFQLKKQQRSSQDIDKKAYYLDQAQKIGKLSTWEYDVKNETIFWTPQNYKIFGIPAGTNVTSEQVMGLVHPDDRASLIKNWQETLAGKPYDVEHRILVHGKIKWIRNKGAQIKGCPELGPGRHRCLDGLPLARQCAGA